MGIESGGPVLFYSGLNSTYTNQLKKLLDMISTTIPLVTAFLLDFCH